MNAVPARKPPYRTFSKMRNTAQIIYAGLAASLTCLTVLFYFYGGQSPPLSAQPDGERTARTLMFIGAAVSVMCVAVAGFLPRLAVAKVDRNDLFLKMQSVVYAAILFAAAFEGAGIYWAVLGLLTHEALCFLGPAVAVAVLVAQFPTTGRLEKQLERSETEVDAVLDHIDQLQQAGGAR